VFPNLLPPVTNKLARKLDMGEYITPNFYCSYTQTAIKEIQRM
jgi:hypothetical protein